MFYLTGLLFTIYIDIHTIVNRSYCRVQSRTVLQLFNLPRLKRYMPVIISFRSFSLVLLHYSEKRPNIACACFRKDTVTVYAIMLVLQKSHNYGYYAKMIYHLFSVRPFRLSGIRLISFRGSLMKVIIIILQETGSRLFGDIFKNISQQWKISRRLENYL